MAEIVDKQKDEFGMGEGIGNAASNAPVQQPGFSGVEEPGDEPVRDTTTEQRAAAAAKFDRPPRRSGVSATAQVLTELLDSLGDRGDGHCNACPEGDDVPPATLCPHACHAAHRFLKDGNFGL